VTLISKYKNLNMAKNTQLDGATCENYTQLDGATCENYTQLDGATCENYTQLDGATCEIYTLHHSNNKNGSSIESFFLSFG